MKTFYKYVSKPLPFLPLFLRFGANGANGASLYNFFILLYYIIGGHPEKLNLIPENDFSDLFYFLARAIYKIKKSYRNFAPFAPFAPELLNVANF